MNKSSNKKQEITAKMPPPVKPRGSGDANAKATPPVIRRRKPGGDSTKSPRTQRASVRGSVANTAALRGSIRMDAGSTVADMEAARRKNTAYEYLCHLEETRKWLQACMKLHAGNQKEDIDDDVHLRETPEMKMLAKAMSKNPLPLPPDNLPPPLEEDEGAIVTADDDELPPPPPDMVDEPISATPPPPPEEPEEPPKDEFELPPAAELEERLRNGVLLVKLAQFMDKTLSDRKMFDVHEKIWANADNPEEGPKLVFRHTDNILQWIKAMGKMGLPKVFFPEVTDIYDKKNMPKAIYCIHALSQFLYRQGIGPVMEDLHGVAQFTEEEISQMDAALTDAGVQMPQFGKIGGVLATEIGADDAQVHAAILAINQAIENEVDANELHTLLLALAAGLHGLSMESIYRERYRSDLISARSTKVASAATPATEDEEDATDIYDTNLTKEELQGTLDTVNGTIAAELKQAAIAACVTNVNAAIVDADEASLLVAITNNLLGLQNIAPDHILDYLKVLKEFADANGGTLTIGQMQEAIDEANKRIEAARIEAERVAEVARVEAARLAAVDACIISINDAIVGADEASLLSGLTSELLTLVGVDTAHVAEYLKALQEAHTGEALTIVQIQDAIDVANARVEAARVEAERLASVGFAVEQVNAAIDGGDPDVLTQSLQSQALSLPKVDPSASMEYLVQLQTAKSTCPEGVLDRSHIEAAVNEANHLLDEQRRADDAVAMINTILAGGTPEQLFTHMQEHAVLLELPPLEDAPQRYFEGCNLAMTEVGAPLSQSKIQDIVKSTNHTMERERIFAAALTAVNVALAGDDAATTIAAIRHESLAITDVQDNVVSTHYNMACAERYHSALKAAVAIDVDGDGIAVAATVPVDGTPATTTTTDDDSEALVSDVPVVVPEGEGTEDAAVTTTSSPTTTTTSTPTTILTPITNEQIQAIVTATNTAIADEQQHAEALGLVNTSVMGDDVEATLNALSDPVLDLVNVDEAGAEQYQANMKQLATTSGKSLSVEQIQAQIDHTNFVAEENAKHAALLFRVNVSLQGDNADETCALLADKYSRLADVVDKCATRYHEGMATALNAKFGDTAKIEWKVVEDDEGRPYYYNKTTKETLWEPPADLETKLLSLPEFQAAVADANEKQATQEFYEANQDKIVVVQSYVRGALAKKKFNERKAFLGDQNPHIVKIQSMVRMIMQMRRYRERLAFLNGQEAAAFRIQAAWKGVKVRRNYKGLTKVVNPPVNTVRRFLHLLDQSHLDFAEELQVGKYKENVVLEIKENTRLEAAINDMDVKIALLVKNRIELQDVVKMSKQMQRKHRKGEAMDLPHHSAGLKSLDSKSRALLQSYQHLFYLLQTDPKYLATMVFIDAPMTKRSWTELRTRKFLDRIIQTTYNFGSSSREKYLSLKLFQTAQRKEVKEKASNVSDMMKEDVTVIRLYINHYRQNGSDDYFKASVRKPVLDVLLCDTIDFTIAPEVVYKRLVHKREAETGEKHEAGYDVNREQAMKEPQVREIIEANLNQLLSFASKMLSAILKSVTKIPFGLRFLGKCLYDNMKEKFPEASEDEVLRVVGNMLFYRYLNPVIAQPDQYLGIQQDGVNEVDSLKRKSLAEIVKLLQMAGTGRSYDQSPIYADVNAFLASAHQQFNKYFIEAIAVETAEIHFNIDEYSDVTMLTKPTIFITPADIRHMHIMLLDNIDSVAPDEEDPIRIILKDLGEEPHMELEEPDAESNDSHEMSLTLTNKFDVNSGEDLSIKALIVRTKRLVVDIIRFQQGKSLKVILDTKATPEEEQAHNKFVLERQATEDTNKDIGRAVAENPKKSFKRMSKENGDILSLQEIKKQVYENLPRLEETGLCSIKDNYQGLLNAVAQDIRNQRIYRRQRKQELAKLKTTLTELGVKKGHMDEQISFYASYVENAQKAITMKKGIKRSGWTSFKKKAEEDSEGRHMGTYKYNAQKLMEKGVLVSVDGIGATGLKQVVLEINRKSESLFEFSAKLFGKQMDNETVDFEELLKLQYDNVTTTTMFNYCTINVNLLIFLLNKKYYSK
eukprot:m.259908 g.259908  ORF g.259908 m.259908 type:complete len:2047 (+) comp38877_c0_seq1:133-6273(+)